MRETLSRNDIPETLRLAHTLRGLAGNIGASKLVDVTDLFEQSLQKQKKSPDSEALLIQLEHVLESQINAIKLALPQSEMVVSPAAVDADVVTRLCVRLRELLLNDDGDAERLIHENAALLKAAFPVQYPVLSTAASRFDFERALQILDEALQVRYGKTNI